MGFEFIITLIAVVTAVYAKRDTLTSTLLFAWVVSLALAAGASADIVPTSLLPGAAAVVDLLIALAAYWLWAIHDSQRARIVGAISLAKLLCHSAISAHFGGGDWYNYALLVNSFFVVQCVVAGGWLRGLVDFLNRVSPRYPDRHVTSNQKRSP